MEFRGVVYTQVYLTAHPHDSGPGPPEAVVDPKVLLDLSGVSGEVAGVQQDPLDGSEPGHRVQHDGDQDVGDPDADPDGRVERVEEGCHCWGNFLWRHIQD